jgi:hypothetical protein
VHESALVRHQRPPIGDSPYHITDELKKKGQVSRPVYARPHWNEFGIYLEKGATYRFTAKGEWVDSSIVCGPGGTNDGKFNIRELAHMAGSLLGKLERPYSLLTNNKTADFTCTLRREDMPWFSLVGVIANNGSNGSANPSPDGTSDHHEYFLIGAGPVEKTIAKPGYLYAFANDAWDFYGNNNGSVILMVERVG